METKRVYSSPETDMIEVEMVDFIAQQIDTIGGGGDFAPMPDEEEDY